MKLPKQQCQYCGKVIHGRSDKRFCDDYCRSSSNNHTRRLNESDEVRNILQVLKSNRRVLETVLPDGVETVRIPMDKLLLLGYNFKYHTHSVPRPDKRRYNFCFDYGYVLLDDYWLLVVRDWGESYLSHLDGLIKEKEQDIKEPSIKQHSNG